MREIDAVRERVLGGALEAHVERQAQRVAGRRLLAELDRRLLPPERVHTDLREPGPAAQVRVVGGLDAGLPDPVAGAVATVLAKLLQLLR